MADDWEKALKRFDERTVKRRAQAKEHDEQAQEMIREAQDRHDSDKPDE
jgi:hypothetical protein